MDIEYFNIEVAINGYVLEYYKRMDVRIRKLFTTKEELLKELDLLLGN